MRIRSPPLLLLFSILLLAPNYSHALNFTYLDPSFQKPWESMTLIDSAQVVSLILNEMDDDADISISYLNGLDQQTSKELKDGINSAKNAEQKYVELKDAKQNAVNSAIMIAGAGGIVAAADLASLLTAQWEIGVVVTVGGIVEITIEGLQLMDSTKEYYSTLIDVVDESGQAYNAVLSKVHSQYNRLERMGATAPIYKGSYANDVSQIKQSIEAVNGDGLSGREQRLKSLLNSYAVSQSVYDEMISIAKLQAFEILDGEDSALASLISIYERERLIEQSILSERESLKGSVSSRYSTLNKYYERLLKDYGSITDGDVVYFGIVSIDTLDSPASHLKESEKALKYLKEEMEKGNSIYTAQGEAYVAQSTASYYKAAAYADSASFELDEAERLGESILAAAEEKTAKLRDAAKTDVDAFIPRSQSDADALSAAREALSEAESYLSKKAKTKSERMANLKRAHYSLAAARSYISSSQLFYANTKQSALDSLAYLKKVMDTATADGIDVRYEKLYYDAKKIEVESGALPASEMINVSLKSAELADTIYDRGFAFYAFVNARYVKLKPLVEYFAQMEGEYPSEYLFVKGYTNADDRFNKRRALGHYNEITKQMNSLYGLLNSKSKSLIGQSLKTNSRSFVSYESPAILLDSKVRRRISFTTFTKLYIEYGGPITITVPFDYDIDPSGEVANPEGLEYSYSSSKLTVMFSRYKQNRLYAIEWEDSSMLAYTISVEENVKLNTPSQLRATVLRTFKSKGVPELTIPSDYEYDYDLYLDGAYLGRFSGDALIDRPVSSGVHTLTQTYKIADPITVSVDAVSQSGSSSTFGIMVESNAPFDIENADALVYIPVISPDSVALVSSDCTIKSEQHTALPLSTGISFTIDYLPAHSSCTITAYASALIDGDLLNKMIEEVENDPASAEDNSIQSDIKEARRLSDAGDLDNAYKKISDAKAKADKNRNEIRENERLKSEYESLNSTVSSLLAGISDVQDKDAAKAYSNAKLYYDAALQEDGTDGKIKQLRKAEKELSKLNSAVYSRVSDAEEKLSELKQRWLYLADKGYADELPAEFNAIELLLSNASVAGHASAASLSALKEAELSLASLDEKTSVAEKDEKRWESSLKSQFKYSFSSLKDALSRLEKACSSSCPSDLLLQGQSLLSLSPSTASGYADALDSINSTIPLIESYISIEKETANNAIGDLRNSISNMKEGREKETLSKKLYDIESFFDRGDYGKAKDSALAVLSALSSSQPENDYMLMLAGLAVVIISFILIKMREKNKESQQEIRKLLKKEEK